MSDTKLHEANRAAHEAAKAALAFRVADKGWYLDYLVQVDPERRAFDDALDAYERLLAKEERISGPNG